MSKTVGVFLVLAGMGVASSLLAVGSDAERDSRRSGIVEGGSADDPRCTWQRCRPSSRPRRAGPPAAATPQAATQRATPPAGDGGTRRRPRSRLPSSSRCRIASSRHRPPQSIRLPACRATGPRWRVTCSLELRRVGCYGGELNGVWTPATRLAMKAFTERVNATLPVGDPDDISSRWCKPIKARFAAGLARSGKGSPTMDAACPARSSRKRPRRAFAHRADGPTEAARRPRNPRPRWPPGRRRQPRYPCRHLVRAPSDAWRWLVQGSTYRPPLPSRRPAPRCRRLHPGQTG